MRYLQRSIARLRLCPSLARGARPFVTTFPRWTPPHIEYPLSPTKTESYATPLLPLPSPPIQPPARGLFVLYVPQKPEEWPSHIEMEDPLADAVGKTLALQGIRTIVAHDPAGKGYSGKLIASHGLVASYETFTTDILGSPEFKNTVTALPATSAPKMPREILVCTHGARDCRCSDIGGDLVLALRHEIRRRAVDVCVTECAHVGGHKYVPQFPPSMRTHAFPRQMGSKRHSLAGDDFPLQPPAHTRPTRPGSRSEPVGRNSTRRSLARAFPRDHRASRGNASRRVGIHYPFRRRGTDGGEGGAETTSGTLHDR